jgi:type II secretory pathway pseudopilin PulG
MHRQQGFTILEMVMTLVVLMVLCVFATQAIKGGLDMRDALSQQSRVTQRLAIVMQRMAQDLEHAFIYNTKEVSKLNTGLRTTKAVFRIRLEGKSHELALTTLTHRPVSANSHESDQTYAVYRLQQSKEFPDLTDLYRGETKVLPENFREEIGMKLFAKNIKSLNLQMWTGERWDKDRWDTESSDWRNRLPQMVSIEIEGWDGNPEQHSGENVADLPTSRLNTVVFLESAFNFKELKDPPKTPKYY